MPVADPSLTVRVRSWQVLLLSAAVCLMAVAGLALADDGVHKGAGWLFLLMGLVFPVVTPTQVVVSPECFIVRHWWGSRTYEAGRCDINRTTIAMPIFHRSHSLVMLRRFGDRAWSAVPEVFLPIDRRVEFVAAAHAFARQNSAHHHGDTPMKWPMSKSDWKTPPKTRRRGAVGKG